MGCLISNKNTLRLSRPESIRDGIAQSDENPAKFVMLSVVDPDLSGGTKSKHVLRQPFH